MPVGNSKNECVSVHIFPVGNSKDYFMKVEIRFDGSLHLEAAKEQIDGKALRGCEPWQKIKCQEQFVKIRSFGGFSLVNHLYTVYNVTTRLDYGKTNWN